MKIVLLCAAPEAGDPAAVTMIRRLAEKEGRSDVSCVSRAVDAADAARLREADLLVALCGREVAALEAAAPDTASRCRLLSSWAPPGSGVAPGGDLEDRPAAGASSSRQTDALRACVEAFWKSLPPAPQDVFAQAVEERFRAGSRRPLSLSHTDWEIIDRWWRDGVPLWIVLQSIEEGFTRKRPGGPPRPRSLRYCAADVSERFEAYRRTCAPPTAEPSSVSGGHDARHADVAATRLRAAAARARSCGNEAAAGIFEKAACDAAAVRAEEGHDAIALRLDRIERDLVGALRGLVDADTIEALRRKAEDRLSGERERMTQAAFSATVSRILDAEIRLRFEVPDIQGG